MDQTNATRAQGQNPSDERGEPSCLAIAVRLPQYWDQHPSAWFLQAESQFQVAGIRSQASKVYYAVAALSPGAINEVADLLNSPLSTAAYDDLKAALLQRTAASQRSRIQQLLSAEELGDRRPSQLLRRMRQLLGDNARSIDDTLLRELFLQRLPANVQMVLATASTMDRTGLAVLADKVMEIATPTIAATTPSPGDITTALQTLSCSSAVQSSLDSLCERVPLSSTTLRRAPLWAAELKRRRTSSRRPRSSSKSRRTGTCNETSPTTSGVCYCHHRFGNDARNCRRPCAWQENRPADL
ncbi:uncharacterized protein LOC119434541 [Dermacentor silvarum]|uniref:uncharacterized protein LOC119434541 n=1 Tax=Dermacentor silvarum TaxID=543639 RepID=UPI0021010C1E|nr:uncharacterized protein LOC119434541 [Dermacentor silvarum]